MPNIRLNVPRVVRPPRIVPPPQWTTTDYMPEVLPLVIPLPDKEPSELPLVIPLPDKDPAEESPILRRFREICGRVQELVDRNQHLSHLDVICGVDAKTQPTLLAEVKMVLSSRGQSHIRRLEQLGFSITTAFDG